MKGFAKVGARAITSDYVIDETATLLKMRGNKHGTRVLFDTLGTSRALSVERISEERYERARTFFLKHLDKEYSFTDCTSFILMKELKLHAALTSDDHFRIAGFDALLRK